MDARARALSLSRAPDHDIARSLGRRSSIERVLSSGLLLRRAKRAVREAIMTAPPEQLAWRGGGKSNSSKFEMDAWHDNDRLYEVVRGLLEELGWAKEARARAARRRASAQARGGRHARA